VAITERIGLEGGPDVGAVFKGIFQAAADSLNGIKALAKDLGLDKELTPQFEKSKKAAADFGDGFNKALKSIADGVNAFTSASAKIASGAAAIGAALFALSASSSKTAHEVEQSARRTGQTTDEFQRLGFGFKQTGVEAGELTRAFAKVSEEATKAAREGKQSSGAFEKFGIALRGADGHARSITAILSDVADVMARTESPTERAGIAAELFGSRVGTKMVGLLSQGSAGIKAMAADAERLGIVLGEHEIQAGTKFEQAMVRLSSTVDATRTKFGLLFAPAFTQLTNSLADAFGKMQPAILKAGEAVANFLAPYIKDIAAMLNGQAQQIETGFGRVLYSTFTAVGAAARGLATIIQGWGVILGQVGAVIDSVLGAGMSEKLLSGAGAAIALAVAFGTLLKSVQLLAGGLGLLLRLVGLGASLTPVGLAIVAIAAGVTLLAIALSRVDWAKWAAAAAEAWAGIEQAVLAVIDAITAPFTRFFDWLLGKIQAAVDLFAKLLGLTGPGGAGNALAGAAGGGAVTAAGGGHVSGPGTSTSDSIPAFLSNNEFVHRAAATQKYGVSFMHSVNNLTFPRFSLGGLVDEVALRLSPLRLAQGGPVTAAASAVNLSLDGRRYAMSAPASTAQSLRAHAVNRQTAATGRKPGWYR
jgi:hypothetical protein